MAVEETTLSRPETGHCEHFQTLQHSLAEAFPILGDETSADWQSLINETQLMDLPADFEIMNPASPCQQFFLILDGSVRVYQQTPDDREVTLYRLQPGDLCVLSINGLMHRKAYGAFAQSESELKCLMFSADQFFSAMAVSDVFRKYVLTSVTDRFNDMLELMETTVFESLDTRLICLLSKMGRSSSVDRIHITHQELARELGTSREVVSRVLKGLERRGCISLARGSIQLKM